MRCVREGRPPKHKGRPVMKSKSSENYRIHSVSTTDALSMDQELGLHRNLQPNILHLLFGMERMKQLARSVLYWPGIDTAIEMASRQCDTFGEHRNKPSKPADHPWMLLEKPRRRLHVDHSINWLVITDTFPQYPQSIRAILDLLEEDFSHFE